MLEKDCLVKYHEARTKKPGSTERIRVVMVGQTPPPIGGVGEQIRLLLDSPLRWRIHLDHVSPKRDNTIQGVGRFLSSIRLFCELLGYCLTKHPDIVHLHTSSYLGFYEKGLLVHLLRLLRQRVVLHIHGGGFCDFYYSSKLKWFIRSTLNTTDMVLALSKNWQAFIHEIAPKARIEVFSNSIDTRQYSPPSETGRQFPPLRVLFVGWIVRFKGVFDLLKVAEQFRGEKVIFDILGDGADMAELCEAINRSGLTHQFILHGWKTGAEKVSFFQRASIFILPSYTEGLPVALLEAMAAGLPIVTSDVGAIPEVVTSERGIICRAGDVDAYVNALKKLLQSSELRQDMGRNACKYAEDHHDIRSQSQKLVRIYNSVMHNGL